MIRFFTLSLALLIFALPVRAEILDIQEIRSDNGITAWLVEDHSVPVIALQFAFEGAGAHGETADKQGLARLASNTMDEGAGDLDSQTFQEALRNHSISLFFNSSRDDFGGRLKTLSRHQDKAFDLLRLALTQPRFDEEPVQRMVEANQSRIRSSLSNPNWIAARIMNDRAYQGHAYAMNSGGTITSLANITPEDLQQFAATKLAQNNLHVAVAGAISADELREALDHIFSALPQQADVPNSEALTLQNQGQSYLFDKDIPQTIIQITQPGIARNDPAYHHAQIMNYTLGGGGFGSRLTEEIREKRGLTYGIYSQLFSMDGFAGLTVETSTANENVPEMLQLIKDEWRNMAENGITETELESAKTYLIGALPLSLTSTDQIAATLLSIKLDGLGADYLDRRADIISDATPNDIKAIAAQILDTQQFVTVLVGQPDIDATAIEELPNVE